MRVAAGAEPAEPGQGDEVEQEQHRRPAHAGAAPGRPRRAAADGGGQEQSSDEEQGAVVPRFLHRLGVVEAAWLLGLEKVEPEAKLRESLRRELRVAAESRAVRLERAARAEGVAS